MKQTRRIWGGVMLGAAMLALLGAPASAASQPITFSSFTGDYTLNRDSRGLSLLRTEETIAANFPNSGYYGITRSIPKKFQDRSVALKVLGVADASGTVVPYQLSTSSPTGDLVVTTGDPKISLIGNQIIKITYQTSGVVNLEGKIDKFLLNINGRGWNQPIDQVNAALHIPAAFQHSIIGQPRCYTSLGDKQGSGCQLSEKKTAGSTVITVEANSVQPNQAVLMEISFKAGTFTNTRQTHAVRDIAIVAALAVVLAGGAVALVEQGKRRQKN